MMTGGEARLWLALIALLFEISFGYPAWLNKSIGHPVNWIGALIGFLERRFNRPGWGAALRRGLGVLTVLLLVMLSGAIGVGIERAVEGTPWALLVPGLLAAALLAQRSLHEHVAAVATALEDKSVETARDKLGMIVGRDTRALDEAAISRAAIESLAENYSDGVVAPAFWLLLGGLPGVLIYKAVNTADSMIGHRNDRYLAFGWAAARLDDLVNLVPARLAGLILVFAGPKRLAAWRAMWRDHGKHLSPNAGWPEAAMAGALDLKLGGPRAYDGRETEGAWLGDGRAEATARDIRRALKRYRWALLLEASLLSLGLIAVSSAS